MEIDIIVFEQKELDNALCCGYRSIALCDNVFLIPRIGDITYTVIGNVKAYADFTRQEAYMHNLRFVEFKPKFKAGTSSFGLGGYGIELI